ncbi:hypothetical protein DAI22_01g309200 [Oryza sativa Japonica Group]|nr:hypothetical protein DAI22_01g309200 [Oryza sativa Japonica Group]
MPAQPEIDSTSPRPQVRVRRRFTSPSSGRRRESAGRRAAATGEVLGRPALPPRPGSRGGGRPPGLTTRWCRWVAAQPEPGVWRRPRCSCHATRPDFGSLDSTMDFGVRARIQSPYRSAAHFVAGER